jgi:3-oxoacyl-(acyl-carrier-protein) synthase
MSSAPASRVAVTGVGAVSAWGWGAQPFWDGVLSGTSAIGALRRFDHADHPSHVAAEVPLPPAALARRFPGWGRLSSADRFALAAAGEAVEQAGLGPQFDDARVGVYFGSSTGGMIEGEEYYFRMRGVRPGRTAARLMASQQPGCPAESVARSFRVRGPVETISSACASATMAIAAAFEAIREGEVDLALAGGADCLCRTTFAGFNALQAVDPRPCIPFRESRAGLSLGEGGAVLVLESVERALARGRVPLAEIVGSGTASDAYHMTAPQPEGEGAARALAAALDSAGLAPEAIDFVNAHGTGTALNDAAEWAALERVFGARAGRLPLTSTKASVGHLLGAAGAIEAVATVLCLEHRLVHPSPGDGAIDPRTPVNLVRSRPLPLDARNAISLNLGFGGCNAALGFARFVSA